MELSTKLSQDWHPHYPWILQGNDLKTRCFSSASSACGPSWIKTTLTASHTQPRKSSAFTQTQTLKHERLRRHTLQALTIESDTDHPLNHYFTSLPSGHRHRKLENGRAFYYPLPLQHLLRWRCVLGCMNVFIETPCFVFIFMQWCDSLLNWNESPSGTMKSKFKKHF